MAQNFKVGATHTGEAFLEFVHDFLGYTLPKFGYKWDEPPGTFKKIFKEKFGDAVILFRSRHKNEFEERLFRVFKSENGCDVVSYSEEFCREIFKGQAPLMELITYLAFLLDIGLFYFMLDEPDMLHLLTYETSRVFDEYVKPYFTVIGGWHALYQVAEQYVNFVNFTPSDIVSTSVSEDSSVSKL